MSWLVRTYYTYRRPVDRRFNHRWTAVLCCWMLNNPAPSSTSYAEVLPATEDDDDDE